MSGGWLTALMFMTLVAGVAFGLLQLFSFMQRRSSQVAAERGLLGAGSRSDHGALPELAGLGVVAVAAMVLLMVGYNSRETSPAAVALPPEPAPASATDRMTDQAIPRANPAEFSQPPTQYPLGSGSPAPAGSPTPTPN